MIADAAIYTDSLSKALHIAGQMAKEGIYPEYSPAHLLKAMLHKSLPFRKAIYKEGKDVFYMEEWADVKIEQLKKGGSPVSSPRASNETLALLEKAEQLKGKKGLEQVSLELVLEALTIPGIAFSFEELKTFPITYLEVAEPAGNSSNGSAVATNSAAKSGQNALQQYCELLTAEDAKFDQVVARNMEIRQMCEILARRSKSNILITGEPGVGKTSLARGLADTIKKGNVPMFLKDAALYELKMGLLLAGATYKGEVEDRVRSVIQELKEQEGSILFIDEVHTIIDEKQGYSGVVNMLKPELASGQLMLIAATNTENYRKTIERDDALSRRFEVIQLLEPDTDKTLRMLKAVIPAYEEHHNIQADAEAIEDAISLSKRYMRERKLPDAAIDLIDRTMAVKKLANSTTEEDIQSLENDLNEILDGELAELQKKEQVSHFFQDLKYQVSPILFEKTDHDEFDYEAPLEKMSGHLKTILDQIREMLLTQTTEINQEDIAAVVASKSGIPAGKINTGEQQRLLEIEEQLKTRVVGQNHAIHVVSEAIKESRSGLANPKQPIGSFFFLGPTGTGKTELAKTLAQFLFYDDSRIIRFDMSEFKEEHSAALLHGAPPGYVGYEEGGMLVNNIPPNLRRRKTKRPTRQRRRLHQFYCVVYLQYCQ